MACEKLAFVEYCRLPRNRYDTAYSNYYGNLIGNYMYPIEPCHFRRHRMTLKIVTKGSLFSGGSPYIHSNRLISIDQIRQKFSSYGRGMLICFRGSHAFTGPGFGNSGDLLTYPTPFDYSATKFGSNRTPQSKEGGTPVSHIIRDPYVRPHGSEQPN